MLFTEIAQTWAVQMNSVNTAIIHSYSTLPRNGRIHGLSKIYRYKQRLSDKSVESKKSEKQKTELVGCPEEGGFDVGSIGGPTPSYPYTTKRIRPDTP